MLEIRGPQAVHSQHLAISELTRLEQISARLVEDLHKGAVNEMLEASGLV